MAWRTILFLSLALPITLLGACADDESTTSGLSGGSSASASSSSTGESSSSSSGNSSGNNETTVGSDSASATSSSTTDEPTTTGPGTTDATTGPGTTDATTGTSSSTSTGTTGGGGCGNAALDPGEQCDGQNLGGYTCEALGYGGGSLTCDPVMCILDTSMCEMGGSTGGTSG